MKFEKPIMNISMFEMENVVTEASSVITETTNFANAEKEAAEIAEANNGAVISVTF